jgi:hypothetical protein
MQNVCEPELHHIKRKIEDGKGRGEQDALCIIASPPSPYLSRLANMFVCNGQQSSKLSCDKCT